MTGMDTQPDQALVLAPQSLTPLTVRQICLQLDGFCYRDAHVLSVARELLSASVPIQWKHAIAEGNRSVFIDKRTGLATPAHPCLKQGKQLLKTLRQQQGLPDVPSSQPQQPSDQAEVNSTPSAAPAEKPIGPSCMLFYGPPPSSEASGKESYYWDFAQDALCADEPPDTQVVQPVHQDLLLQCGLLPDNRRTPQQLTFYSWWYEDTESPDLTLRVSSDSVVGGGLRKRYCTVQFDIAQQTFAIKTASEDQELVLGAGHLYSVTSSTGTTVDVWDLHVGATLVILGKRVTLLKAELSTAQWNDWHAVRLKKLRKELQEEVQKYKPRALQSSITFNRGSQVDAGGLALKNTVNQIHTLITDLRQYRPSKAEKYLARIGIDVPNNTIF